MSRDSDAIEKAATPKPRWRRWLRNSAFAVGLPLFGVTGAGVVDGWRAFGKAAEGERLERMMASPQWEGSHFENPEPIENHNREMFSDMFDKGPHGSPDEPIDVIATDPKLFDHAPGSGLRVTWLGHSTTLIEIDGKRILTDPIWGEIAAPVTWLGPSRWYDPPLAFEDLPQIDAVLISHDHYDHLDEPTMTMMKSWKTRFIVPLGVGAHLEYWGIPPEQIDEVDWFDEVKLSEDFTVACTPARHASGRTGIDKDKTLWAGYALLGKDHRVFFSGDTGLFRGMREIGNKYGPFDITMIEVGAYGVGWPDWHIGPEQAIQAHQWLKGELFLPIHWGMWDLATHNWTAPIERTIVAAEAAKVQYATPRPGGSFEPDAGFTNDRWWPEVPWKTADEYPIVSGNVD